MSTPSGRFRALHEWYQTPLGHLLSTSITPELDKCFSTLFGHYLLQIGFPEQNHWLSHSPANARFVMSNSLDLGSCDFYGEITALPLQSESIDICFLPHTLEIVTEPQALLAEIDRVLIPEGYVVILGFNPVSWWGLRKILTLPQRSPWQNHWHLPLTINRYLQNQGFLVTEAASFFYRYPLNHLKWMEKTWFLESVGRALWPYPGGVYLIVAQKQVAQMMPIRPIWNLGGYVFGKRALTPT